MKGTLFSADFIKETDGNIRLLEVNTDTGIVDNALDMIDFSGFIEILSGSNITEVHTITKEFHRNFVDLLSQSLHESASFINDFQNTEESYDAIYPTTIEDTDIKFILRLAYDESAIFDSTYCKNKVKAFELFTENSNTGSIVNCYISSSEDGYMNTLERQFNSDNNPDLVVKTLEYVNRPLKFYKIGNTSDTSENRYSDFIDDIGHNKLFINFYEDSTSTYSKSIRSLNILYGSDLDLIHLGTYENYSLFEKPNTISWDTSSLVNEVDIKHYYEFTTNTPTLTTRDSYGGLFEEEQVIKSDGTPILIGDATESVELKSYFINGAPNTDVVSEFMDWYHTGSEVPSGSYETSSVVINQIEQDLAYNIVQRVVLEDGVDFRASAGSHMLIYDVNGDKLRYESVGKLDPTNHRIINLDGGTNAISQSYSEVLDGDYKNYIIDMEETDTFFLYNGQSSVKIVTHNCFPAGTKITLSDGSEKNVEDLTLQDKLLTWNEKTGELVEGVIGDIVKKKKNSLIHLTTEDGTSIKSTPLHKFYSKERGWISAKELEVGEVLVKKANVESKLVSKELIEGEIEVYHILNVKDTHTYFAEDLLVHNLKYVTCFTAGTEITLLNGDVKNIEDIIVGDEILSYNEKLDKNEIGVVGEIKSHEVNSVIRLTLDNENIIITTEEHPFFVDGKGWVKAVNLQPLDVCKKVDGSESLISTVETLEETHIVYNLLNVSDNRNFYANGILVHNK